MDKKRILVVDDEPELLKAIEIILERDGYEVIAANDGLEGLARARKEEPDLIILDITMAQMDGYTMLRELKQKETTKSIPVIVVTAHTGMKELFSVEGIKDYIVKPYDTMDLTLRVSRALEQ